MISKLFIFLAIFQSTNIISKLSNSYTLHARQVKRDTKTEGMLPSFDRHPSEELRPSFDRRASEDMLPSLDRRASEYLLPSFDWCGPRCMKIRFPDGWVDRISLVNLFPTDETNPCIFDGTFEDDTSGSITVSGCQNDPNVYITVYSNRLRNRNIFNINEGVIEEPADPYEIDQDDDYLEDISARSNREKRDAYIDDYNDETEYETKDYIEEDYDEVEYDGAADLTLPPTLILNISLSFEETMKAKLGSEAASQRYIQSVLSHTRKHLQHATLGTKIELNIVGSIEFVPNRHWAATSPHMEEAKLVKKNDPWPTIYFCHTDDTNNNTGIAFIRKGCHPRKAIAIVKHRKNVNVAAITLSHEIGHLLGKTHDWKEDKRKGSDRACSGTGIMSSKVEPHARPARWSSCSSRRFSMWYKRTGHACLVEPSGKIMDKKSNHSAWLTNQF